MITLTGFKNRIEGEVGYKISNSDLVRAIEDAKNDVVVNNLICGKDVTSEYFTYIVSETIKISMRA